MTSGFFLPAQCMTPAFPPSLPQPVLGYQPEMGIHRILLLLVTVWVLRRRGLYASCWGETYSSNIQDTLPPSHSVLGCEAETAPFPLFCSMSGGEAIRPCERELLPQLHARWLAAFLCSELQLGFGFTGSCLISLLQWICQHLCSTLSAM